MRRIEMVRPMHVRHDGHAVHGVCRQNAVSHHGQASGLRRVQIDGPQSRDRQERPSDSEDSLETRGGSAGEWGRRHHRATSDSSLTASCGV